MGAEISADIFVTQLAQRHRVLMLGGMAVIAHGFSRKTKDVDVWLEPTESAATWVAALSSAMADFATARFWSLAQRRELNAQEIAGEIADFGVLRVSGFDRDIDVFRRPNELELEDFEMVWAAAKPMEDGTRLPSEPHLLVTKANTGREHDFQDQIFLEGRVKQRYRERLPVCDAAEARGLMERFLDPEVLAFALENPEAEVRAMALAHLREFEAEGDPYSRDILAAWRTKNPAE